jgi:hypothetical protein
VRSAGNRRQDQAQLGRAHVAVLLDQPVNLFESKIFGGSVPKEYIPGVEKGLEAQKDM